MGEGFHLFLGVLASDRGLGGGLCVAVRVGELVDAALSSPCTLSCCSKYLM